MADDQPKRGKTPAKKRTQAKASKAPAEQADAPKAAKKKGPLQRVAAERAKADAPATRPARRKRRLVTERTLGGRALVVGACFVIIVAGMKASREILVPFLFSLFIAVLAGPPIQAMKKRGMPTGLAMLVVLGALALSGLFVTSIVTGSLASFDDKLPTYKERLKTVKQDFEGWLIDLAGEETEAEVGTLDAAPDASTAAVEADEGGGLTGWFVDTFDVTAIVDRVLALLDPANLAQAFFGVFRLEELLTSIPSLLSEAAGLVTNAALILLTVVFLLLESSTLPRKILAISGENGRDLLERIGSVADDVNRYMALKTLVSLITGVLIAVWLSWLRVDFALLWGLLAFLLNFIPNLGSILAGIPAVLLAWIQLGPSAAGLATLGFVAVNGFVGNVLEPRWLGRGLGLSTLVVFLSLIFWGWVLGPAGMLLSVPLTMACKVALQSSGDMRWVAILLSGDPAKEQAVARAGRSNASAPPPDDRERRA